MLKKEKLRKKLKYVGKTRVLRARSIYMFYLCKFSEASPWYSG